MAGVAAQGGVPPALRDAPGAAGPAERRVALRALARAAEASGFPAAAGRICATGRIPDDASCDLLARRIASGEPDLSARADMSACDGPVRGAA